MTFESRTEPSTETDTPLPLESFEESPISLNSIEATEPSILQPSIVSSSIHSNQSNVLSIEDEQIIKETMAKIEFPNHAIPFWAKFIPEEEWLQRIRNSISTENVNR